jgi:hypothetical protein
MTSASVRQRIRIDPPQDRRKLRYRGCRSAESWQFCAGFVEKPIQNTRKVAAPTGRQVETPRFGAHDRASRMAGTHNLWKKSVDPLRDAAGKRLPDFDLFKRAPKVYEIVINHS